MVLTGYIWLNFATITRHSLRRQTMQGLTQRGKGWLIIAIYSLTLTMYYKERHSDSGIRTPVILSTAFDYWATYSWYQTVGNGPVNKHTNEMCHGAILWLCSAVAVYMPTLSDDACAVERSALVLIIKINCRTKCCTTAMFKLNQFMCTFLRKTADR